MDSSENKRFEKNFVGCLYLIPSSLGGDDLNIQIPPGNTKIINQLNEFIVENERTARRFLKKAGYDGNFDLVTFHTLDKHTPDHIVPDFLKNALTGKSIGLLSEAGYPCIADPGQKVVKSAHNLGIKVIPLVGPSSILMALVSSGFNGQNFVFHGYLPIEKKDRIRAIKAIESDAIKKCQTQIFMETPYRNNALLLDIITNCSDNTQLCIASNITCEDEYIKTMSIAQWGKNMPDLHKKPGIFLIYRE
jgi:16S rRNA (cytidine1402-2'-O)-methyltransferase